MYIELYRQPAIYKITNTENGKFYIGSAVNFYRRILKHIRSLNNRTHHSIHLQRAWNKHGGNKFIIDIIEKISDKIKLIEREQFYLDFFKTYNPKYGYNICPIAGSVLGRRDSLETRKKKSDSHKGEKAFWYGKNMPDSAKQKLSDINRGKIIPHDIREKISEKLKGKIPAKGMLGLRHSEQTKWKIRCSNSKPVFQFSKNREFIKAWHTTVEAADFLKISKTGINSNCVGGSKSSGGFIWSRNKDLR